MNLSEINIREKDFHNKLQSQKRGRFENIFYKALYNISEDFFDYLKNNANNAEILDYGCGVGSFVEEVSKFGPKKNCWNRYLRSLNNTFDIVYGSGILHHLQINKCLDEIHRVLKPNGSLVFIEPLGTNPIINFYRKLTPKSRSKDEHPLMDKDFKYIKSKFTNTEIKYYGLSTLIFFPFYKSPNNSSFFKFLTIFDQYLFKLKFFQWFAWSVLIRAKKS